MIFLKNIINGEQKQVERSNSSDGPQLSGEFQVIVPEEQSSDVEIESSQKFQKEKGNNKESSKLQKRQSNSLEKSTKSLKTSIKLKKDVSKSSLSKDYFIIDLNDLEENEEQSEFSIKSEYRPSSSGNNLSQRCASTVKIDDYYMIVDKEDLDKKFVCEQDWERFYEKVESFRNDQQFVQSCIQPEATSANSKKDSEGFKLNLVELNSIVSLKVEEKSRRIQYWNRIAKRDAIKFRSKELTNKKDLEKLNKNLSRMVPLIEAIIYELTDKGYRKVENVQEECQSWKQLMARMLTIYGANDRQIGYSKGIEYVALGLLVAKQKIESYSELQSHFKYLMMSCHLRNMYFPGTPKLYEEIGKLESSLKAEVPELCKRLLEIDIDFVKIFINYYKSYLMYKLRNSEVIRKIMELLVIYGIDLVRIILVRIMNLNEKKILGFESEPEMLKYIAENLVIDYWGDDESEGVIQKLKQLFVLEVAL